MRSRYRPRESLLGELPRADDDQTPRGRRGWRSTSRRLAALAVLLALAAGVAAEQIGVSALAATTGPLSWSAPTVVDDHYPYAAPQMIDTLSCTSDALCVGDTSNQLDGDIFASTTPASTSASSWSVLPTTLLSGSATAYSLAGTSCVTAGASPFCVIAGANLNNTADPGALVTTANPLGGASAFATQVFASSKFEHPSCASSTVCIAAATDPSGSTTTLYESSDPSSVTSWTPVAAYEAQSSPIVGTSCPTTTLCLAATYGGTVLNSTTPTNPSSWHSSSTTLTDTSSFSCASAAFCLASDDEDTETTTNPGANPPTWTSGTVGGNIAIDVTCFPDSRAANGNVICIGGTGQVGSGTFDDPGGLVVSVDLGANWEVEALNSYTGLPEAFDCPSDSGAECFIGTDSGAVITGTNVDTPGSQSFSAPVGAVPGVSALTHLVCPSTSLCVGGDEAGNILTETNGAPGTASSWTAGNVDPDNFLNAIGCTPSGSVCVGVDDSGHLVSSSDPAAGASLWSAPRQIDTGDGNILMGVSCPTASLCVSVDESGSVFTSTNPAGGPLTWSSPAELDQDVGALSCAPGTTFCLAIASGGNLISTTNPAGPASGWSSTGSIDGIELQGVSCPSISFCIATDAEGDVVTSSDPADGASAVWSAPAKIDSLELPLLACASASLCVASDETGGVLASSDPGGGAAAWSATTPIGPSPITALACAAGSTQCLAGDNVGDVLVGGPPAPGTPPTSPPVTPPVTSTTATVASTSSTTTSTSTTTSATKKATPPPPPVLGKSEDVTPVSGTVLVELPAGASTSSAHTAGGPLAASALSKGRKFIPLSQARQIPVGSILDTTKGTVGITAATPKKNTVFSGDFAGGIFELLQSRTQKGLSDLNLMDTKVRKTACVSIGKKATAAKSVSSKVLGLLKSTVKGSFTTRGGYSSATARGTAWTMTDECAGTLTHVTRDVVSVDDFATRKTVLVRAGHSFLAKASGVGTVGKRKGPRLAVAAALREAGVTFAASL